MAARVVPWCRVFTPATALAIDRYLRKGRAKHPQKADVAFWLGHSGPLTDNGVAQMLNRRGRAAGLGRIHAHQFRHTVGTWFVNSGVSSE